MKTVLIILDIVIFVFRNSCALLTHTFTQTAPNSHGGFVRQLKLFPLLCGLILFFGLFSVSSAQVNETKYWFKLSEPKIIVEKIQSYLVNESEELVNILWQ